MSPLREKTSQMFMVGLEGEALTGEERSIIDQYRFGGFILFGRNCCDPAEILSLCRSLWQTGANHPPFIAIDQEGGRVYRLPSSFTHFPAAAAIGRKDDLDLAYRAGRAAAAELALVGINLNFAPVLDVNSNPQNPIIGDRSFGADPARVISLSDQWTKGLRDGGIIPCGKHFPGHGSTDQDSHLALPVVDRSLDALRATEFPPFIHACRNGIEALMIAHVLYRALDADFPATLSHAIVTGLLRQQWGYRGVVFSDDMEMKAVRDDFSLEEVVGLAARAGIDVFLFCHDLSSAVQAFEFLCAEAERSSALRAQVENNYQRIAELKRRRVTRFTGVAENELAERLARLNHQVIVDEIQGSL